MARMYEAECLADTMTNVPPMVYEKGKVYVIEEGHPCEKHFRRIGAELPQKEVDRIKEQGPPPPRPAASVKK